MGDKCFGLGLQPKFLSAEEFEALLDEVVRTIINFGAWRLLCPIFLW